MAPPVAIKESVPGGLAPAPIYSNKSSRPIPPDLDDYEKFSKLKKELIKPENVEKVKASWKRLLIAIEKMVEEIKQSNESYIPEVDWQTIKENGNKVPTNIGKLFEERGCLMVRNVIDTKTVRGWYQRLLEFVAKHPEVGGYPTPITNWFVFWNKAMVEARSHPEITQLMSVMSQFFYTKDETLPIDKNSQIVYPDAFRVRPPGQQTTLDLHLDSGSIERWEDKCYREVYATILEGRWEEFEPFELDVRSFARSDLYSHLQERPTATSAFRTLQGWLALTSVKSGEGTIRFLPNIKLVSAYLILRPFFWKDNGEIDLETSKFPGAVVGSGQFFLSEELHPHLKPLETVMNIPYANEGDYIFWHCDVAHEVDKVHNGDNISSVFFNALCPLAPYNVDNMLATRNSFLTATPPRDFDKDRSRTQISEGDFPGEHGAERKNILTDVGLRALGLKEFDVEEEGLTPGQIKIREFANKAMKTGIYNEDELYSYMK